jgi:hypothetical protein
VFTSKDVDDAPGVRELVHASHGHRELYFLDVRRTQTSTCVREGEWLSADGGPQVAEHIGRQFAGTVTTGGLPRAPVSEIANSNITKPNTFLERISVFAIQNHRPL